MGLRLREIALGLSIGMGAGSSAAFGAEVTDVADAADTLKLGTTERDDPFDLYFSSRYTMDLQNGLIAREPITFADGPAIKGCSAKSPRGCVPVDELRYKRAIHRMNLGLDIGLFHDLALSFGWAYVISDTLQFRYAKGVDASTSTVDGVRGRYFAHDFESVHAGSGDFNLGFKWGILNDERDVSKPAWVVYFDWQTPWTSKTYDPKVRATRANPGSVGNGTQRLTFGTSLSKRVGDFGLIGIDPSMNRRGYLDPYFDVSYTLPIPQKSRALPDLIRSPSNTFGRKPSHEARMNAGVEFVPLEDLIAQRKIAVDVGLRTTFYSEGRNYSELTDPLGELTYTEQYMDVGGHIGFYAQAADFARIKVGAFFGYRTEHFLTNEEAGKDKNGDGQVIEPADDPNPVKDTINPYACGRGDDVCSPDGVPTLPSYDQVGFRFRDQEHALVSWFIELELTF